MTLAMAMERRFAGETSSYTTGRTNDECPGFATYRSGDVVPAFGLRLDEPSWHYEVRVFDRDGDGKCEAYELAATGIANPVLGKRLTIDSTGKRTGDWPLPRK